MNIVLEPDLCVIGGGASGQAVAMAAASLGLPTVLVERGPLDGSIAPRGSDLFEPMIAAAARAHGVRTAKRFGINASLSKVDFPAVLAQARSAASSLVANASSQRLTALGVQVLRAEASFADPRTITAGDVTIRSRRVVLATGCRPRVPEIAGLDQTPYLTEDTILDLVERPERLVIIGAGARALEWAQVFRRLGSEVALVCAGEPLSSEDPELARILMAALRREGIAFHAPFTIQSVEATETGVRLTLHGEAGGKVVSGSTLLIADRTAPDITALGLHRARIGCTADGITVDGVLRTSNRRVHAVGGLRAGGHHSAAHDAMVVLRSIAFRSATRLRPGDVPYALRTDPGLAHVGLTEAEARRTAGTIRVFRWPYAENARAQAEGVTEGHIKIITNKTGHVLGASIVGARADDMITVWAGLVRRRAPLAEVADLAFAFPALADIGRGAALAVHAVHLTKPWVRRIIAVLRNFG